MGKEKKKKYRIACIAVTKKTALSRTTINATTINAFRDFTRIEIS